MYRVPSFSLRGDPATFQWLMDIATFPLTLMDFLVQVKHLLLLLGLSLSECGLEAEGAGTVVQCSSKHSSPYTANSAEQTATGNKHSGISAPSMFWTTEKHVAGRRGALIQHGCFPLITHTPLGVGRVNGALTI